MTNRFHRTQPPPQEQDAQVKAGASAALPADGDKKILKRLRPRWQRWLLWATVRLLLLAGIGVGVGTVQRMHESNLMAHAHRIASLNGFHGFTDWVSKDELTLYRWEKSGGISLFRWNVKTRTLQPLGWKKNIAPAVLHRDTILASRERHGDVVTVKAWVGLSPMHTTPTTQPTYVLKVLEPYDKSFLETWRYEFAPDGKHVAYLRRRSYKAPWDGVMHRFIRTHPSEQMGAGLFVSDVEGKSTVCLGYVVPDMPLPYTLYNKSNMRIPFNQVLWCPDGKHLSFAYGDGVYKVPVK